MIQRLLVLLFVFTVLFSGGMHICATPLSKYEVTYEILEGTPLDVTSANVTLEIQYDIKNSKASGFKYVGFNRPYDVRVYDENGNDIEFNIDKDDEYKIEWTFDEVLLNQKYTMFVDFELKDVGYGDLEENTIEANWPGNFKDSVSNVTYRLILSEGYVPGYSHSAQGEVKSAINKSGCFVLETFQPVLKNKTYKFKVKPGFKENKNKAGGFSGFISNFLPLIIGAGVVLVIVVIRSLFGGGRRGGGGGLFGGCDSCSGCDGCGGCGD